MKRIAIDLTWVRHKKVGGTEACVRNLLDGISGVNPKDIKIVLILARDNADSFNMYNKSCFEVIIGDVDASNQLKRVVWQNLKLGKLLKNKNIYFLLEPIYSTPFLGMDGIKVLATIHDLQALHYPEYFTKKRVQWMKSNWKHSVNKSVKIIAISDYVRNDIIHSLKAPVSKVVTIYDAIDLKTDECCEEFELLKYGVKKGEFYYTVSSLLPHKNLKTIVKAIAMLKKEKSDNFFPLIISGVGGGSKDELMKIASEYNIADEIILTPFVENNERNMLYKNCKAFIFPSIFEGFGMPPIEAMAMGTSVLTTRYTSLEEVTGGLLNYVDDPLNPKEWVDKLESELAIPEKTEMDTLLNRYSCQTIAEQYLDLLKGI